MTGLNDDNLSVIPEYKELNLSVSLFFISLFIFSIPFLIPFVDSGEFFECGSLRVCLCFTLFICSYLMPVLYVVALYYYLYI